MTGARPLALLLSWAVLCAACSTSGLSFREDDRVDIIRPKDRAEVNLPVRVDWTVEGFAVGEGAGSFGVFVDRAPQPPKKTLGWPFRNNDLCRNVPGCPDADFLAERYVFRTTETSFVVDRVVRDETSERREFHEVTVVLLDERGRRVGEGAWSVQFQLGDED